MTRPLMALHGAEAVKEPDSTATGTASAPTASSTSFSSASTSSTTVDPFPCLQNASNPSFNASACPPTTEVEERWVVWELHSTVAVAVGAVVVVILVAAVVFILHHRQRRRQSLQRAASGYSATSFNSSINEAAAGQDQSHANPALQHSCDVYDIDDFSLDNDSFLHTLESFEYAHRHGPPTGSYGRMRGPPAIIHPSASATVAPAPLTKGPQLDPLSVRSMTPTASTISSVGSGAMTKTFARGDV